MEFKKINITLPVGLYQKAESMIKSGMYAGFSDLVRSMLRKESSQEESEWKRTLNEIRAEMRKTELAKLSKEELLEKMRKTREEVSDELYGAT